MSEKQLEELALKNLKEISAPMGLSEWETTEGATFYSKSMALAAQIGIERIKQ